jgi:hypothetical protein
MTIGHLLSKRINVQGKSPVKEITLVISIAEPFTGAH